MFKGTFLEQQLMLRLLFRLHSVHLKLRGDVEIQVVIKKGHQHFIIPHRAQLVNCVANFETHTEFFIDSAHPVFDIMVIILHGSVKKLAGQCQINLKQWEQNSNNQTISLLQKSADPTATINFDFMYLASDIHPGSKKLMSVGELQSQKKNKFIKEMEDKYQHLSSENERLVRQVANLKQKNKSLVQIQQSLTSHHSLSSEDYQQKLRSKDMEIQSSENHLKQINIFLTKIRETVNNCQGQELKVKIEGLLNQEANSLPKKDSRSKQKYQSTEKLQMNMNMKSKAHPSQSRLVEGRMQSQ